MKKIAVLLTGLLFTFINVSFAYAAGVTPQMFHGNDSDTQVKSVLYCNKDQIQPTEAAVQPTKACHISKCDDPCFIKHKEDKPVTKPTGPLCICNVVLFSILFLFLLIIILLLFLLYMKIRKFKREGFKEGDKDNNTDVDIDKCTDIDIGHNVEKNVENNFTKNKNDCDNCHKNNKPYR